MTNYELDSIITGWKRANEMSRMQREPFINVNGKMGF